MQQEVQLFLLLFPFILLGFTFYLLIYRPQKRYAMHLKGIQDGLKPNVKIISKGGIIGTVKEVTGQSVILSLHDESTIEILKSAVIALHNE